MRKDTEQMLWLSGMATAGLKHPKMNGPFETLWFLQAYNRDFCKTQLSPCFISCHPMEGVAWQVSLVSAQSVEKVQTSQEQTGYPSLRLQVS